MTKAKKNDGYKKFVKFLGGCFVLVLGITLILCWWSDVIVFFKGITGMLLAGGGLLTLYLVGNKT
ncbi:hypothetical protein MNBD_BACTEROID05-711 [hydrothermal vent metagenome]|uniref:Uncharacterized protein n=1 Tax=hydrothermal vent metagenome TaxID=652676 RepID=A0A3B0U5T3_9ZZZZ